MDGKALHYVNKIKRSIIFFIEEPIEEAMYARNSESQEILRLVYKQVESFEELAQTTMNTDLDKAIAGEVDRLQDIAVDIAVKSESNEDVMEDIHSFNPDKLKMMENKCSDGLYNVSLIDDEDVDQGVVSSEMIGVHDVYGKLKDMLMSSLFTSVVGMPGIGKTTIANKLFNDPTVVGRFDHRVWVRVGKRYRAKDIPRRMLEEMDPDGLRMLPQGDEEVVREQLKASLKSKRYLVVLDDVWDRFTIDFLDPIIFSCYDQPFLLPNSESRILTTGRLQQLNENRRSKDNMIAMRLLNKEESWDLLREKVFSQGSCPPQLVKTGKKISEKCEGLPLTILAVARLLPQDEKIDPKYWDQVAAQKNHQIFVDAYDEISKVLLPSYTYLPPLLQMCFMFIGLFPQKYEVPRSKLFILWLVDGFIELNIHISSNLDSHECMEELVSNSLVMVYQQSTLNYTHNVKTCGLHTSLWHLAKKKARETKFALLLSYRTDGLEDDIKGHHRLSFHNNVLFAIKDVHKSVEDNCASVARSLFCFAPYHQYQVPLCFRLKLIKELDALSIRFYEFPMEVLQLAQLTYLSLTSNGMIPNSISQLQFLEFLIVDRHQNIKPTNKDTSYLPVEIWSMQKLKHLQVTGSDLPSPPSATFSNLSTLLNVSAGSCTNPILRRIPNLKELIIRIELTPDDDGKPLICFGVHQIYYLYKLFSLKCVIVNPVTVPPIAPFSCFPKKGTSLTKLSLSGLMYPWKEMRNIASILSLKVLKLKNYAFQGSEWDVDKNDFKSLISLVIEDTDLVDWKCGSNAFRELKSLTLKQCYKLQKIHGEFGTWPEKIKLVDCNPSFVEEMKKIVLIKEYPCVIDVQSSWVDEKLPSLKRSYTGENSP